jgi:putative glycosyltransferase (TIGR04372 family)
VSLVFQNIWRKTGTVAWLIATIILSSLCVPFIFLIRLLSPWITFRFGYFTSDRLGHWIFDIEYYLVYQKKHFSQTPRTLDLFFLAPKPFSRKQICNSHLETMAKRTLSVNSFFRYLFIANNWVPCGQQSTLEPARLITGSLDIHGQFSVTEPNLRFTDVENNMGHQYLEQIGCTSSEKLVCLIVRDNAYLQSQLGSSKDWQYHDFRDSDIERFRQTALWLSGLGYCVVRMGKTVATTFSHSDPGVVDYANSPERSDFLDIWLVAHSHFCISNSTGLDEVATVFRRPILLVDFLPLRDIRTAGVSIGMPKHLKWHSSTNHLSLDEYLEIDFRDSRKYNQHGVRIESLTSGEIEEAAREMIALLENPSSINQNRDQLLFWEKLNQRLKERRFIHPKARISTGFFLNH